MSKILIHRAIFLSQECPDVKQKKNVFFFYIYQIHENNIITPYVVDKESTTNTKDVQGCVPRMEVSYAYEGGDPGDIVRGGLTPFSRSF